MNIEQIIYQVLSNDAAVSAIVSTRITPLRRMQDQSGSAITYQKIDGIVDHSVEGPTGWEEARWQINCWTNNYDDTITLAKTVEAAFDGYSGGGIDHVFLVDDGDMPDMDTEAEELQSYGRRMDFIFYYND